MTPIAHIETPFASKFGIPRQAGLVDCESRVVFEPPYRSDEAVRGLDGFDYLWLVWQFHLVPHDTTTFKSTVRPPRLGGNTRMGVFATRSPFRPNPIGLSCVRLLRIDHSQGPVLVVQGADMVSGTPILDIKPYLPYADAHPDARAGFAASPPDVRLQVADPHTLLSLLPADTSRQLVQTLQQDPRPHYHAADGRRYTLSFYRWEVSFVVDGDTLSIVDIFHRDNR